MIFWSMGVIAAILAGPTAAEDIPGFVSRITSPALTEISGACPSRHVPGGFWVHNDSGDGPYLYLIDAQGKHLATVTVRGAKSVDWEDICGFELDGKPYLMIGDAGDNRHRRHRVQLYVLPEPRLRERPRGGDADGPVAFDVRVQRVADVAYEDGPVDCEALAFDPAAREVLLISKRGKMTPRGRFIAPGLYTVAWPEVVDEADEAERVAGGADAGRDQPSQLLARRVGPIPGMFITAADLHAGPKHRELLVSGTHTYRIYRRANDQTWAAAIAQPVPMTFHNKSILQGEAACFDRQGQAIFLFSEGRSQPFWRIDVKPTTEADAAP